MISKYNHDLPKYNRGDEVVMRDTSGPPYAGHKFVIEGMFWSDLLHSWVYYVPTYKFYQCESDLEII